MPDCVHRRFERERTGGTQFHFQDKCLDCHAYRFASETEMWDMGWIIADGLGYQRGSFQHLFRPAGRPQEIRSLG